MGYARTLAIFPFLLLINAYRILISPLFGRTCRFEPTCSRYGIEVLKKYGVAIGLYKIAVRLIKCHPFHPGGFDPP